MNKGIIFLFLLIATISTDEAEGVIDNYPSKIGFSPKVAYDSLKKLLPTVSSQSVELSNVQNSRNGILNLLTDELAASASHNDDWVTFVKRIALKYLTSKDQKANSTEIGNALATEMISRVPQFVKESLAVQRDGSLRSTLEKKLTEIIKTLGSNSGSQGITSPEGKQLTPFDPLVFGVNSLINLGWFWAFSKYCTFVLKK